MSVIAGDPHRIFIIPPRNMRESAGCAPARSTIIGEPEAARFRSGAVDKMTAFDATRVIPARCFSLRLGPRGAPVPADHNALPTQWSRRDQGLARLGTTERG